MNIWTIRLGEPLAALDNPLERPYRAISVAQELARRGHEVRYWTSSMDHYQKRERCSSTIHLKDASGVDITALWATPYKKNFSIKRIFHHLGAGREFLRTARSLPRPDIICSSYPTAEVCLAVASFARNDIPIVFDVRDMWPDIFPDALPKLLRPFGKMMLLPFTAQAKKALRIPKAITGITDEIVAWAVAKAGRERTADDRAFHLAYYPETSFSPQLLADASSFWDKNLPSARLRVVFIGAFSTRLEILTVVEAAKLIPATSGVSIVIAGGGEQNSELRAAAAGLKHVFFPGWINAPQIFTLLQKADCGLLPYPSRRDFLLSFPNKVGEYLSAGLPIITSVDGVLGRFLRQYNCGMIYPNLDARGLAGCITSILDNPEKIVAMRENAKTVFKEFFDANRVYSNMADWLLHQASTSNKPT